MRAASGEWRVASGEPAYFLALTGLMSALVCVGPVWAADEAAKPRAQFRYDARGRRDPFVALVRDGRLVGAKGGPARSRPPLATTCRRRLAPKTADTAARLGLSLACRRPRMTRAWPCRRRDAAAFLHRPSERQAAET